MIEPIEVTIENFQSIKKLTFKIEGFTCITGRTNIGKSAIMRALGGALLNNSVVGSVRKGSKYCSVEFKSNSWGLKWEKGERSVNRYWIPGKEEPIDKLGQGQHQVAIDLGFPSIKIGSDVTQPWFASQFDPVFLLNKSGPAVTDFISEVSRLKVIQDSIVLSVRKKKRAESRAKIHEEELLKLREVSSKLSKADSLEKLEKDLTNQANSIGEYEIKLVEISDFDQKLSEAAGVITTLKPIQELDPINEPEVSDFSEIKFISSRLSDMELCAKDIIKLRSAKDIKVPTDDIQDELKKLLDLERLQAINQLQDEVNRLEKSKKVKTPEVGELDFSSIEKIESISSRKEILENEISILEKSVPVPETPEKSDDLNWIKSQAGKIEEIEILLLKKENELQKDREELEKVKQEISQIPTCPTCERVWSDQHTH